jgi:hypothetical protein
MSTCQPVTRTCSTTMRISLWRPVKSSSSMLAATASAKSPTRFRSRLFDGQLDSVGNELFALGL